MIQQAWRAGELTGYRTFLQVHDELGIRQPGAPLIIADYSSLEVGVQGDLCCRLFCDEQIIGMYDAQGRGIDIHSNNARAVFGRWLKWTVPERVRVGGEWKVCKYAGLTADCIPVEEFKAHPYGGILRGMIKEIWYGLAYGKGAYGFSTLKGADGKMIGEKLAGAMVNALLGAVPGMRRWMQWVRDFVRKWHGIYSLDGRWCDLSIEMESDDEWMHERGFRRAYNFPCQATGAGIIGDAMVRVHECPVLPTLGAADFELAAQTLVGHMKAATANGTPLMVNLQVSVGWGENYYEAK